MKEITCPNCSSLHIKLNGHIHNGKQNRLCKDCGRQFVVDREKRLITDSDKALIDKLLLEKISLAGIARVAQVSQVWLQGYVSALYSAQPDDLHVQLPTQEAMEAHLEDKLDAHVYRIAALKKKPLPFESALSWEDTVSFDPLLSQEPVFEPLYDPLLERLYEQKEGVLCELYRCEADEMWTFVGKKENKQWLWLVMNTANRQIIAFHVGGRGQHDAKLLFEKVPEVFRQHATFFTDFWNGYHILDQERHVAEGKEKGYTNHIERFNNTLRQRCSRLVRKTLAFSKKLENHMGAIKYFICHYNKHLALLI